MSDLLATAPSLSSILESITRFYCGTPMRLEPAGVEEWEVVRISDAKVLSGVIVKRQKKRFRFEMVTP